jgi:hypothetical protein
MCLQRTTNEHTDEHTERKLERKPDGEPEHGDGSECDDSLSPDWLNRQV